MMFNSQLRFLERLYAYQCDKYKRNSVLMQAHASVPVDVLQAYAQISY